jgi:hypothetical protein
MESIGGRQPKGTSPGYWYFDEFGYVTPAWAKFFYNVLQQQMLEARLQEHSTVMNRWMKGPDHSFAQWSNKHEAALSNQTKRAK